MIDLSKIVGFNWDAGNLDKNKIKHDVEVAEAEQVFFNEPVRYFDDEVHSGDEIRYGVLGKTNAGRKLTIFFTIRKNKIRIISAYDQAQKDRKEYLVAEKEYEQTKN